MVLTSDTDRTTPIMSKYDSATRATTWTTCWRMRLWRPLIPLPSFAWRDEPPIRSWLENRQWVEWRSCSVFHGKRSGRHKKFPSVAFRRFLRYSFQVEVVEERHAQCDQRELMNG